MPGLMTIMHLRTHGKASSCIQTSRSPSEAKANHEPSNNALQRPVLRVMGLAQERKGRGPRNAALSASLYVRNQEAREFHGCNSHMTTRARARLPSATGLRLWGDGVSTAAKRSTSAHKRVQPIHTASASTNVRLGDGTATVKVTLSKKTSGRLLFGYRSPQERYLSAGLAGYRHAYTVTDFEPTSGWRGVALAGTEENLVHEREYKLLPRIAGQHVYLELDDIPLLTTRWNHPRPRVRSVFLHG